MTNELKSHIGSLDIQELRLLNGDHIIAEVIWDRESDDIVIKDPLLISNTITNGARSYTEWLPYSQDQYFSIDKSSIIAAGNVTFDAKVFFCRLVLTRNIKGNLMSGNPQSSEDLELLKEIALIMGETNEEVTAEMEDEVKNQLYSNWADDVDDTKVH